MDESARKRCQWTEIVQLCWEHRIARPSDRWYSSVRTELMKVVERVSQGVVSHRDRLFSQRPFFVDAGLRARLTLKNILPGKQWSITGIALLPLAAVGIPLRSTVSLPLF